MRTRIPVTTSAAGVAAALLIASVAGAAEPSAKAAATAPAAAPGLPTKAQLAWHELELGMFVHMKPPPASYMYPPDTFENLAECAKLMGARYILFVAKHNNGYLFWNSKTRARVGIQRHAWKDGKGDVLGEIVAAARKRGIGIGVYNVPADWGDGVGDGGACKDPVKREAFIKDYLEQVRELLTHYGPLVEYWMDGGIPKDFLDRVNEVIQALQPDVCCFQGTHNPVRWVGNEQGYVKDVFWNRTNNPHPNGFNCGIGDPRGASWVPFECDTPLGGGWSGPGVLRKFDNMIDIYYQSVGRGAGLVWNLSPPVSKQDMAACEAFGKAIADALGHPLAAAQGRGKRVELEFKRAMEIDHVVVQEDLACGERVLRYVIEALVDEQWKKVGEGQSLGHKRIFKFKPVAATKVRLTAGESLEEPVIRSLYVTRSGVRTPDATPPTAPGQLVATLDGEHAVKLQWKPADDPESGIRRYRVWRNGALLDSTSATDYRDRDLNEQTAYEYAVAAVNGSGLEGPKAAAKVTTPRDQTAPKVERLVQDIPHHLVVSFDEPVEEASACNPAHYTLDGGAKVTAAAMHQDPRTVKLAVAGLKELADHTLSIREVRDRAKEAHRIAADTRLTFRHMNQLAYACDLTEGAGKQIEEKVSGKKLDVAGEVAWQQDDRKALRFDGKTTCVDLGPMTCSVSDPFTIALGFRFDRAQPLGRGTRLVLVSRDRGLDKYVDYKFQLGLTDGLAAYFAISPEAERLDVPRFNLATPAGLPKNQWVHLALTRDADFTFRLYVDGKPVAQTVNASMTQPYNPVTNLILGGHMRRDLKAYMPSFAGALSHLRVYGRALDDQEVATLAQTAKQGK